MNDPPYVSCICIDGVPIIGPVMTDERRSEMRRYRELAIARESELQLNKRKNTVEKEDAVQSFTIRTDGIVVGRVESKEMVNVAAEENVEGVSDVQPDLSETEAKDSHEEPSPVDPPMGLPRIPIDESEVSFQSCSSKFPPPSGYSSDDSTFRSNNSHRYYSSTTTNPNEDETTTDASLPFRPTTPSSDNTIPHLDDYLAELSLKSQISNHTVVPILTINSNEDQSPRPPRLIRSNSYTLDEPSPAFLKHLQLQQALHQANDPTTDEKQDDEMSEKNIPIPQTNNKQAPTMVCAARRKSLDMTSNAMNPPNCRKTKAGIFKKTPGIGGGGSSCGVGLPSRRARPAFERVYSTKTSSSSSIGPKSGSTNQRKPAVVINGLAVEGQKVNNVESMPQSAQQRARKAYESPYMLTRPPTRTPIETHQVQSQSQPQSQSQTQSLAQISPTSSQISAPEPPQTIVNFDEQRIVQLIQQMEIDRQRQMDELVERQQVEQRRLQDTFIEQQRLLVTQITEQCSSMIASCQQNVATQLEEAKALISPTGLQSPCTESENFKSHHETLQIFGSHDEETSTDDMMVNSSLEDRNNNNNINKSVSNNQSSNSSCSRDGSGDGSSTTTAVAQYNQSSAANVIPDDVVEATVEDAKNINTSRRLVFEDSQKPSVEWMAATQINAYARGFLTRRLFRTDDVQTIVKVIRDTLLFVIDLHHEANQNEDLQLKRSLLKQLNSACYMLHDIFFNKSTVQRMEIISTDRRIQRRKLLQAKAALDMRRSTTQPAQQLLRHIVATNTDSNKSLNKLSRISLFPVEILGKRMTRSETMLRSERPAAAIRRSKSLGSLPVVIETDIW